MRHERKCCYVYRHYAAGGVLLYVGISNQPIVRLGQHAHRAAWFPQIERIEIQKCESRRRAERAEWWAINSELPLFNRRKLDPGHPGISDADLAVRLRYKLADAYALADKGTLMSFGPIEFATMTRDERRHHRRLFKRRARLAHRQIGAAAFHAARRLPSLGETAGARGAEP